MRGMAYVPLLLLVLGHVQAVPANFSNTTVTAANCTDRLNLNCINSDLEDLQSSLLQLFLVTAVSGIWLLYLTFFHSRLIGFVLTKVINQFYKDDYFHIGTFSFSLLSGKIMFRDVLYVTVDQSIRLQDGYIIFRWWRPYNFTTWIKQKDLDQGHTRLNVYISHLEFHQYNRTWEYDRINGIKNGSDQMPVKTKAKPSTSKPAAWRSLFPVIKFTIASGKFIFGNRLLPNTLVASFEDGDIQYKTTEASNPSDIFMHVVEGNLSEFRVKLTPSADFDPSVTPAMLRITKVHNEPPPRKMGNGFPIVDARNVHVKYLWDEAGVVPESAKEVMLNEDYPIWEMHIRCGKRLSLNYGPWADRQRELLWKFFFPPDYQKLKVSQALEPGEVRLVKRFFFSMNFLHETEVDIMFTESVEKSSLTINTSKGSCFEVDIPMLVQPDGYDTAISGQLLFMQATTTRTYQHFFKAETLSFHVKSHYPLHWNGSQTWTCDISSTKATCTLLFAHKDFLANLMEDWAQKVSPDLLSFVPYTFAFSIKLQELELILPTNAYNWIDCSTRSTENAFVGLYGKQLDIDFTLPFDDFLPLTCKIPFKLDLQNGELAIFLPESNPARNVLLNLSSNMQKWNQDAARESLSAQLCDKKVDSVLETVLSKKGKWGLMNASDWVKCWQVAALQVVITYSWHPVYLSKTPTSHHKGPNPTRLTQQTGMGSTDSIPKRNTTTKQRTKTVVTFDPTTLEADEIRVDLLMAPGSTLYLYGSLLDLLVSIKENYFGYDDVFTDFASGVNKSESRDTSAVVTETENPLNFRPLQVTLDINLSEINGVLPIHPTPVLQNPPSVKLQKLTFEMDKNYHQTRLQLLLSKLDIKLSDCLVRSEGGETPTTEEGHIQLDDLQLRGHAMFSGNGLPIGATLIEYAWLTEVLIGPIKGRVSIPQTQGIINWAQSFIYLLKNDEHQLNPAFPGRTLPTGITWAYTKKDGLALDETDVKYLMSRIRVDDVHLQVAEGSTVLDVTVAPVTISNGNVQERGVLEAVSAVVEDVQVKQRVMKPGDGGEYLDAGEVGFGPLIAQVTMATDEYKLNDMQEDFLKFHDRKTRRLDFLWESAADDSVTRRTSSGVTSLLENVRSMKSWGCSFFTPLTTKHPTFFYNQQQQKTGTASHYVSAVDDVSVALDDSFDEEDVFDAGMDFGMSLLVRGRKLLTRSWVQNYDKVDGKSSPTFQEEDAKVEPPRPVFLNLEKSSIPAGAALMAGLDAEQRRSRPKMLAKMKSSSSEFYKRSTESNLYCSAESDFKSTSSLSSGAYFSAESDVDETASIKSEVSSEKGLNILDVDGSVIARPDVLEITPDTLLDPNKDILRTPIRKHSVRKQTLNSSNELARCYERILPSSKALPIDKDSDSPVIRFSELAQGVHASVIVKKDELDFAANRRYSMDVLNQTNEEKFNSTNIKLHVKDSVNVQVTPFLLESLHQIVEAAQSMVAWQHPLAVLCDLQEDCVTDASTAHEVLKSAQEEDARAGSDDVIKPGFQIQLCVDSLCVNVVQATLGDDPVFNLHINKLLPNPAMSILSIRFDQVDIHFELNSKHNKLLSKILTKQRKISSSSSKSNESKAKTSGRVSETNDDSSDVTVFDFIGHVSVDSVALQLRVLSEDGKLPERTSMISIPDRCCRASFQFDDDVILPDVKTSMDEYEAFETPRKKRQPPLKPWGWVTIEAGCRTVVANIVKQVGSEKRETTEPLMIKNKLAPPRSNANDSFHVHFEDSTLLTADESKVAAEDHVTNGVLNVDLVWLNVVTPLSSSQALKRSRACRTWNLLTSIAPSVSAWLDPLDRLVGSLDRFEEQLQTRKYAVVNASLVTALEKSINEPESGRKMWDAKKHKFGALTELSKSIKNDASFKLCDALQRFLRDPDELTSLEASLEEPPALATLEKGFQIAMAQWHEMVGNFPLQPTGKSRKKTNSTSEHRNTSGGSRTGIKFDGSLELSMLVEPTASQQMRLNDSGKQPLLTPEVNRRAQTRESPQTRQTPTAAQELVYKQQQSMYSWMQNSDVEAQRGSFGEQRDPEAATNSTLFNFKAIDLKPESIPSSQEKFEHFMKHIGFKREINTDDSSNFIRSLCSGSLMLKVNLKSLRIDKQNPDKLYTREASFQKSRRDRTSKRRSFAKSDPPILLFQGFMFNASIIDTIITEHEDTDNSASAANGASKRKAGNTNNNNTHNDSFLSPPPWEDGQKQRSTLKLHIDSSLKQATQKVDIDLVRLIHQFIQCSDAIQQAKTDIQVNKYTAGSTSPDPMSVHKRTPSNITNMSGFSAPLERPTLHRRQFSQTSGILRFHSITSDSSSISSSTDSDALARAWQILYRLIDLHNKTGFSVLRSTIREEYELDGDRPRGLSNAARQALMLYQDPFLSMVASGTFQIRKVNLSAEFGDLKLSVLLSDLQVSVSHTQTAVNPYKKEAKSILQAELAKIHGDITEHLPGIKKTVITCDVAASNLDASTNHKRDSCDGNTASLRIGQILIDLPQHPASLHDVVSRGTQNFSSHFLEFSRTPTYKLSFDVVDGLPTETPSASTMPPLTPMTPMAIANIIDLSQDSSEVKNAPVVLVAEATLEGVCATVNLLSSLRVTYVTEAIEGSGRTGPDANFSLTLSNHELLFVSEVTEDSNLDPVSTKIQLPAVKSSGELMNHKKSQTNVAAEGELREGDYLRIKVQVGSFDHSLTTDLFNQLVFFHEVFMQEVNDVILKVSRGKKPIAVRSEASIQSSDSNQGQNFLYELEVLLEGIRLTATTPSSNAVRLKTGKIEFELSNRVLRSSEGRKLSKCMSCTSLGGKSYEHSSFIKRNI
uniref:Uncharacterized protein KIAA1109 n=1 Tax=Phallusia mammillata TaxID=59560 RepID=A0A6F9DGF5_9ASCI|nr:uncharacterized protein KIAA1109 [Phallusia mammillata]